VIYFSDSAVLLRHESTQGDGVLEIEADDTFDPLLVVEADCARSGIGQ
jgi:hypothetical protein